MLHLAELAVRQRILDLDLHDKYGGIVQRILNPTEEGDKYYPVSCFVSVADCWENGMYTEMTPDSSKKGVIYFEQIGDLVNQGETGAKGRNLRYTGKLRLVAYFNLMKHGKDSPCRDLIYMPQLIKAVKGNYVVTGDSYKNTNIEFSAPTIKSDSSIFRPYTYDKTLIENLKLYPHSYYAMDFNLTIIFPLNCHIDEAQEPEITCLTTY